MWSSTSKPGVEECETPSSPSEFFMVANNTFDELTTLDAAGKLIYYYSQ